MSFVCLLISVHRFQASQTQTNQNGFFSLFFKSCNICPIFSLMFGISYVLFYSFAVRLVLSGRWAKLSFRWDLVTVNYDVRLPISRNSSFIHIYFFTLPLFWVDSYVNNFIGYAFIGFNVFARSLCINYNFIAVSRIRLFSCFVFRCSLFFCRMLPFYVRSLELFVFTLWMC